MPSLLSIFWTDSTGYTVVSNSTNSVVDADILSVSDSLFTVLKDMTFDIYVFDVLGRIPNIQLRLNNSTVDTLNYNSTIATTPGGFGSSYLRKIENVTLSKNTTFSILSRVFSYNTYGAIIFVPV